MLSTSSLPHCLPSGRVIDLFVGDVVAEVSGENHSGKSFLVVCTSGYFNLFDVKAVQEINERIKIHRLSYGLLYITSDTLNRFSQEEFLFKYFLSQVNMFY